MRLLIISVLTLLGFAGARAQEPLNARYVFENLESPALDLVDKTTRMDMADYAEAHRAYEATNRMAGIARLDTLGQVYARFRISQASEGQLLILPGKKGSVVALVYTIGTQGKDSELLMYDSALKPMKVNKIFTPPLLKDFLKPEVVKDKKLLSRLDQMLPFIASTYTLDPQTDTLTAHLSTDDILSEEDQQTLERYLSATPVVYHWTGTRFTRVRQ